MKPKEQKQAAVVAVLDAGGQYVDLVKKACQRLGYPTEVIPLNTPAHQLKDTYKALIISGSPASSHQAEAPMPDPEIWKLDLPIMGICYGLQAMVTQLGGEVVRGAARQDGRAVTDLDISHPLFTGVKPVFSALFTHGDFVSKIPAGFTTIGNHTLATGTQVYSAIARDNHMAVQFHPEVFDDTPEGYQVFRNFLQNVAQLAPDNTFVSQHMDAVIAELQAGIRAQAGDKHVIAFVSGGVDSSVTAALAATEVSSDKLHAFYIDNGLMRDEDDAVVDILKHVGVPVQKVNATDDFLKPLTAVSDPQEKRQIIGRVFVEVQNRLVSELGLEEALLLQGTNAADRIESGYSKGDSNTALIKTHHNQVQEVQDMKARGLLIEPLDELFKDEVRAVGKHLGLPEAVVMRQPFPGPGLAVRILCTQGEQATASTELEGKIQDFVGDDTLALLLPVRSVGVGGDERSHAAAVALQGAKSWAEFGTWAKDIPANFRGEVNRVVVALGDKTIQVPTATRTFLEVDAIQQLRHADRIVWEEMRSADVAKGISQFPVVLLPLSFGKPGERSVVLRPVTTSTFMTVQAMLPERDLPLAFIQKVVDRIIDEVPGISQVFIDLTAKPPGTTEWE